MLRNAMSSIMPRRNPSSSPASRRRRARSNGSPPAFDEATFAGILQAAKDVGARL